MAATQERTGRPVFGRRDPDVRGYFGEFGGRFVPETLVAPMEALTEAYLAVRQDEAFIAAFEELLRQFVGRPTPLYEARRLSEACGGATILLKREDLAHTGAHKINNALGQALLARRMGKSRIVAETGAGQHGVATATVCALLGMQCVVYMGVDDMARQALNVFRMRLLGAEVRGVDAGSRTLKDAINEAMRDWVATVEDTYYLLGSALGPHPYPLMVREFQSVIGEEARVQCLAAYGRLPDAAVACVGGGSNAMGLFDAFVADRGVRLIGIEAGGEGIEGGRHAATVRRRHAGRAPGDADVRAAGCRGQHRAHAFRVGWTRLCGRRTRACRPAAAGPGGVPVCHRPRSARGLREARATRGHPARARIGTCDRGGGAGRTRGRQGRPGPGESVGTR